MDSSVPIFMAIMTIWATLMVGLNLDSRHNEGLIAAIKDQGCSSHPHKVIEQKQIKDTYNMKGFK